MKSTLVWPITVAAFFVSNSVTCAETLIPSTLECSALSNNPVPRGPFTSALPFTLSGNTLKAERIPRHGRPGRESYIGTISANKLIKISGQRVFFDSDRAGRYQFSGSIKDGVATVIRGTLTGDQGQHRDCSITFSVPPAKWAAILAPLASARPQAQLALAKPSTSTAGGSDSPAHSVEQTTAPRPDQAGADKPSGVIGTSTTTGPAPGSDEGTPKLPERNPSPPITAGSIGTATNPPVVTDPAITLLPPAPSENSRRVALVIGESNYAHVGTLPNPHRDADAVAASLRSTGFQTVIVKDDMTHAQMISALNDFSDQAANSDWALIYFSGHGLELAGTNYVVPVDAKLLADRDVQDEAVSLDRLLSATMGSRKLHIVILDACRDNPFIPKIRQTVATRSIGRGLARVEPEGATLVVYAARDGQIAYDGDGQNSPFVTSLTKRIAEPNLEISKLFRLVRDDVLAATGKKQEPYVYGSLPGDDFFFTQR
jgi:Caspase domain